ncbi:hypothetical protein ACPC54_36895 [Kitasatospora sp. NPDC094028]
MGKTIRVLIPCEIQIVSIPGRNPLSNSEQLLPYSFPREVLEKLRAEAQLQGKTLDQALFSRYQKHAEEMKVIQNAMEKMRKWWPEHQGITFELKLAGDIIWQHVN